MECNKISEELDARSTNCQLLARQYIGKLHFVIKINQLGLFISGLNSQIGIKEMIILDYIQNLSNYYTKGGEKLKFTLRHLIKALPILKELKCASKASVSRIIKKLEKLNLIDVERRKGKSSYIHLTEKASNMINFRLENCETDRTVSASEEQGVSIIGEHSVSAKLQHNSSNSRSNNNFNTLEETVSEFDTEGNINKYRNAAMEHFHSLNPADRRKYDTFALNLLDFSCPKPKGEDMDRLRIQYYIDSEVF